MRNQSVKIKELVQDLNLVSQLEYEMQPLHLEVIRLSSLSVLTQRNYLILAFQIPIRSKLKLQRMLKMQFWKGMLV